MSRSANTSQDASVFSEPVWFIELPYCSPTNYSLKNCNSWCYMIAMGFTAETSCGFVKVFDFHDWKQWNVRNVTAEVQTHKKMNHLVSMHLRNHSSAFKNKAPLLLFTQHLQLSRACFCEHYRALTTGGSKPLIKYLWKDSASVNIEQQGEPLPPCW